MKISSFLIFAFLSSTEGKLRCYVPTTGNESSCTTQLDDLGKPCIWCEGEDGTGICIEQNLLLSPLSQELSLARCTSGNDSVIVSSSSSAHVSDDFFDLVGSFGTDDKNPYSDDQSPASDDETPSMDDQVEDDATPASDDEAPASDDQNAYTDDEAPVSDDQAPATDDEAPATDDQNSYSDDEAPETDDEAPETDDEAPETDDEAPETDDEAPETDDEAPETDDEAPATDDEAPATDDESPTTDDKTPATDDNAVPDDFWTCLQKKSSKDCPKDECTWCETKAGFGLCMSGPAAASASQSAWFNCSSDLTSVTEFDQTYEKFTKSYLRSSSRAIEKEIDVHDFSCINAFLNDQTESACTSVKDSSGSSCRWCSIAGMTTLCLTANQADMGAQLGISCDNDVHVSDPYDPSCALAYLQDPTEDGCLTSMDADGASCEFCSLQDSFSICLNQEQASLVSQFGLECDSNRKIEVNPLDTSCALAFLQDQSEDACKAAIDEDGNNCEYCLLPGSIGICLTLDQAQSAQQLGLNCDEQATALAPRSNDPLDTDCMMAYLQNPTEDACLNAQNADGNSCEFCSLQGSFFLCLSPEQAAMSEQLGITCQTTKEENIKLPPDFLSCLENYNEGQCEQADCTWCNTQVGIGFCLANAAAEATKECSFFDCEFNVAMNVL